MAFHGGFTPRQFPIDPFDTGISPSLPWPLDQSALPDDVLLAKRSNVILVLGEPPLDAITPLLYSPTLAASLVIFATSRAYTIPPNTSPAVRILRLSIPLASVDSDASSLAAVFQWADTCAAAWRVNPAPPTFEEVFEDGVLASHPSRIPPPHIEKPKSRLGTDGSESTLPLSSPAKSDLAPARKLTSGRKWSSSGKNDSAQLRIPTQRVFDAVFNFLPSDVSDRHLLKHAILVTTLARPFLVDSYYDIPPLHNSSSRRFNFRGPAAPRASALAKATAPKATYIIHLIPPARASLVRPLESFCLSFSFPVRGTLDTPRPYLMAPAALAEVVDVQMRRWSLAELVLCGALDGRGALHGTTANRAWIRGAGDIAILARSKRPSSAGGRLLSAGVVHSPSSCPRARRNLPPHVDGGLEELGAAHLPTHREHLSLSLLTRHTSLRPLPSTMSMPPDGASTSTLPRSNTTASTRTASVSSLSRTSTLPLRSGNGAAPGSSPGAPLVWGVGEACKQDESWEESMSERSGTVPKQKQKQKRRGFLGWIKH